MGEAAEATGEARRLLDRAGLDALIAALREEGYTVVGPRARDGAIVYDPIASTADLPEGWTDEQEAGRYRLRRREDRALFGYNVGPHSWKRFLYPPSERLWTAERKDGAMTVAPEPPDETRYAFLAARSCELEAVAVQDAVFMGGAQIDLRYKRRRERAFFVAVHCGQGGGTCFCVSMDTGPKARSGYDIALTELLDGGRQAFLAESGSPKGEAILAKLPAAPAAQSDVAEAEAVYARAASQMGRKLDATGIQRLFARSAEHPRWTATSRCLSCTNCTLVCPTCFCGNVEDKTDLEGTRSERTRVWDSCFTMDFSYLVGGSVRTSASARYRHWITHKLATWIDQFGTSGCVGCGRCIAWCPVGIDITEEVEAIRGRAPERRHKPAEGAKP